MTFFTKFYVPVNKELEHCYYLETEKDFNSFTDSDKIKIRNLLTNTFEKEISPDTTLAAEAHEIVEFGPMLNVETPWCTNALNILNKSHINGIIKIEYSTRTTNLILFEKTFDKMTQKVYLEPLTSFVTNVSSQSQYPNVYELNMFDVPDYVKNNNLGLSDDDCYDYVSIYEKEVGRGINNAELVALSQVNSEHSRHHFFRGIYKYTNDKQQEVTDYTSLMDRVKTTWKKNKNNSVIAFKDNASAILGFEGIFPELQIKETGAFSEDSEFDPYNCKVFLNYRRFHFTLTAETHNFPTGIAPFQGATTGVGGRIRDTLAIGRGGYMIAGLAGYSVGNIYKINSENFIHPMDLLIQASNGASDYGNKVGEPIIGGFTRSFECNYYGNQIGYVKPIMFSAGIGLVSDNHLTKITEEDLTETDDNILIVRLGGPAFKIGVGGGSASSRSQDSKNKEIDLSAVQRGDPQMECKLVKLIQACIELDENNPIDSIHDQGAGGLINVASEITVPYGGMIYLNKIAKPDKTMTDIELLISEHQEQVTVLVKHKNMDLLRFLATREGVPLEMIGHLIKDANKEPMFKVYGTQDDNKIIEFPLKSLLENSKRKVYDVTPNVTLHSNIIGRKWYEGIQFKEALVKVLGNIQVASKSFLTNKVDRSVSGLIAQQQCVGYNQIPISDYSMVSHSYYGTYDNASDTLSKIVFPGVVSSIGEQPIKGLIDIKKMVRLTVAEMLTNLIFANIEDFTMIRCSANWMWANQSENGKYQLRVAVQELESILSDLKIAIDGGKDSLSMSVKVNDSNPKMIHAPNTLVLTSYVSIPDMSQRVTSGFVRTDSKIIHINMSAFRYRIEGSILAQCYDKLEGADPLDVPDFENPIQIVKLFTLMNRYIRMNYVFSGHDISDGGLITTLCEMTFPNNIGIEIESIPTRSFPIQNFFAEEPGIVIEVHKDYAEYILKEIKQVYTDSVILGNTTMNNNITINTSTGVVLDESIIDIKKYWCDPSFAIEKLQANKNCIDQEIKNTYTYVPIHNFNMPKEVCKKMMYVANDLDPIMQVHKGVYPVKNAPKVAIIRDEGSNGDREMRAVLTSVGFDVYDIHINDMIYSGATLDSFRGIVFVGGFTYSDVFGSAQGWASVIINNEKVCDEFDKFKNREDTFSLGVCNGCQLMALLEWIPYSPRFMTNNSERFESRYTTVKIVNDKSIFFEGMQDLSFGIWIAHGEGRYVSEKASEISTNDACFPIRYVDADSNITESYPYNPNGSIHGIAGSISENGRHLAMMPHPERSYLNYQAAYIPEEYIRDEHVYQMNKYTPWILMFHNMYNWCSKKME